LCPMVGKATPSSFPFEREEGKEWALPGHLAGHLGYCVLGNFCCTDHSTIRSPFQQRPRPRSLYRWRQAHWPQILSRGLSCALPSAKGWTSPGGKGEGRHSRSLAGPKDALPSRIPSGGSSMQQSPFLGPPHNRSGKPTVAGLPIDQVGPESLPGDVRKPLLIGRGKAGYLLGVPPPS